MENFRSVDMSFRKYRTAQHRLREFYARNKIPGFTRCLYGAVDAEGHVNWFGKQLGQVLGFSKASKGMFWYPETYIPLLGHSGVLKDQIPRDSPDQ